MRIVGHLLEHIEILQWLATALLIILFIIFTVLLIRILTRDKSEMEAHSRIPLEDDDVDSTP